MANFGYDFTSLPDGAPPATLDIIEGDAAIVDGALVGTTEDDNTLEHNVASYANVFAAIVIESNAGNIELQVRVQDGDNNYYIKLDGEDGVASLRKRVSAAQTVLEDLGAFTLSAGDACALHAHTIGSTVHLRLWTKPAAGAWAPVGTGATDSSFTSAGTVRVSVSPIDTLQKLEIYDSLATGDTFPTAGTSVARSSATAWTDPGNVVSDNTTDATCNAGASGSAYLVSAAHGFALPSTATILGVTARVEASEHSTGDETLSVQLQDASAALTGSAKTTTLSGTTKVVYSLGGPSARWGATITPSTVNDADFGIRSWYTTAQDVRIDYTTVNVFYITAPVVIDAGLGTLTVAGAVPSIAVSDNQNVTTSVGALSLSGLAPTVVTASNTNVLPDVGALTVEGLSPVIAVSANITAAAGVGELTAEGVAPTVTATTNALVRAGVGALALSGFAPTIAVTDHRRVATNTGALAADGFVPDVAATTDTLARAGLGAAVFSGFAPNVSASNQTSVDTDTGALTATGLAPVVAVSAHVNVTPASGTLGVNGFAPIVAITNHQVVTPSCGLVTVTGYAPTLHTPVDVLTDVGELVLSGLAPDASVSAYEYALISPLSLSSRPIHASVSEPLMSMHVAPPYTSIRLPEGE